MFSYNAANKPKSKTTRMFRPVRQVAAPVGRQAASFGGDRQVAASGAKSGVSDCILLDLISGRQTALAVIWWIMWSEDHAATCVPDTQNV